ncbi:CDP-alcohol phosphatidyltransferase family protein [Campylobacter jejuni]|uniref:CDP-alcohol phosphatidyltransferase family protein n=1 Tax=Campylobacter jejuni TaxID=197 RepID=UPI003BA016E1
MNLDERLKKKQRNEVKSMYIIEYFYRIILARRYLPFLAKINIHPIAITALNTIIFPITLYFLYFEYFLVSAILIQIYALIDHTDGMLARYTNKQTYIGSRLDRFNDNVFFNAIFIFIALGANLSLYLAFMTIICMNIHNAFGMFYFSKKLRSLKKIRRFGIKKWFLDRNFILGIDCSLMLTLVSLFLIIDEVFLLFYVVSFLYLLDVIYRFIELKRNQNLDFKEKCNGRN